MDTGTSIYTMGIAVSILVFFCAYLMRVNHKLSNKKVTASDVMVTETQLDHEIKAVKLEMQSACEQKIISCNALREKEMELLNAGLVRKLDNVANDMKIVRVCQESIEKRLGTGDERFKKLEGELSNLTSEIKRSNGHKQ